MTSPVAFELRNDLAHHFFYAYRNNPDILENLRHIMDGGTNADMVQDLMDLSQMGKNNPEQLEVLNFDMSILDKAEKMSDDMADLLANVNGARAESNPAKILRDKAYVYLKEVMDEIRNAGQYLFWHNEYKRRKYTSSYLRRKFYRQKGNEEAQNESYA